MKSHFEGRDFKSKEKIRGKYIFVKSHFADEERLLGDTPSWTKRDFGE
jgi:hypothetical protein